MGETEMPKLLQGKNVIVTGAADGIGAACARAMLQQGASFLALADINTAKGQALADELSGDGYKAKFYPLDVREETQWQALLNDVVAECGSVDVLVNNAGVCIMKPIVELSLDEFRQVNDVNVKGVFLGTRCVVQAMRDAAGPDRAATGSIVNIASIAGQVGLPGAVAYGAGKAAITNMTKALAVEFGEKREFIRVNSVHPGAVRTAMTTDFFGEDYFADKRNFDATPLKDHATVKDIANAVVYLASDQARLVTGSELTVDGGHTTGLTGGF